MKVVRKADGRIYDLLGLKLLKTNTPHGDMVTVTVQNVAANDAHEPDTFYAPGTFCYKSLREFFDDWEDAPKE